MTINSAVDTVILGDETNGVLVKTLVTNLFTALMEPGNLIAFTANANGRWTIDVNSGGLAQSGTQIATGLGLLGGGDISADRTIAMDLSSLGTVATDHDADFVAIWDVDGQPAARVTVRDLIQPDIHFTSTIFDESQPVGNALRLPDPTGINPGGLAYSIGMPGGGGATGFVSSDGTNWRKIRNGNIVA